MANSNAVKFVKNLVSVFHRYPITPDVKERLAFKCSQWKFTEAQWERILDLIVDNRKEDDKGLPEMPEIIAAINQFHSERAKGSQYGTLSFRLNGIDYAIRCVNHDGIWVSVKTGRTADTPKGATDIVMSPDNPPQPKLEDLPTAKERKEFMAEINANLSKLKEVPF